MTPSEVLRHLVLFVEDPEDVATLTPAEVEAELAAEGIDLEAGPERLRERLAQFPGCGYFATLPLPVKAGEQ